MKQLRVAHLTLGLDVGGQERLLVEFGRHTDRRRFHLTFVSMTSRGKLASVIEESGWPVLAMNERPGIQPGMIWRLARLLRREKVDVVHTHDDRPLLYGGCAGRIARVQRHIHMHHHGFIAGIPPRRMILVQLAARLVDEFVCVSHDSARYMREQGVRAGSLMTIWNGIDTSRYPYQGPQSDGPAVTVARLSPEKDVANLVHAAALLARSLPDFRLIIAGDGPCRADLEALAAELNIADRVEFLGEVRDIAGLLRTARMFVLPSQTEGISLTILESMACGLPVVATRVGGNPEVVTRECGILVPPIDPVVMARAIAQLWSDPHAAANMGTAARRRVEANFNVRKMVAAYESLYCGESPVDSSNAGELRAPAEASAY